MRVVFGIEVSKASSEVAILVNGERVHGYTIPNDAIGFNRLLGGIRRFHSANQIIAFIGIDLRHYESCLLYTSDAADD